MPEQNFSIITSKLRKDFDKATAVRDIDLAIAEGTITGLLGGNGAGKSTTMAMLLGLLQPTSGNISILGYDLATGHDKISPFINFSSPYVDLPNRLTVRQNLNVYGHLYGIPHVKTRIDELVEHLHIADLLDRRHGSLSAGQRTRSSLAKSLLNKPKLLLLDEPTASLDPDTADWVRSLLMDYRRQTGATIFMSSHNMYEVERMCDDIIMMKKGEIVARGTPQHLMNSFDRNNMEEVFLTSPELEMTGSFFLKLRRVWGITLRHLYLYRESWPRLLEMMYWPIINISLFGFVSLSMIRYFGHATILTDTYLGGLLLAELLTRSVMAFLVMYMEEVWSRNLGHLFASPLRLRDYIASLMTLSATRCLIAVIPAFIVAYYLFGFSILRLGWILPMYAVLLLMCGWWYGLLIISLLMRFGLAAEWMGWMGSQLLIPFMAPYYAVSILPHALQYISWALPGTYVFESMKEQLASNIIRFDYLAIGFGLNLVYIIVASAIFSRSYQAAKRLGGLLQMGE